MLHLQCAFDGIAHMSKWNPFNWAYKRISSAYIRLDVVLFLFFNFFVIAHLTFHKKQIFSRCFGFISKEYIIWSDKKLKRILLCVCLCVRVYFQFAIWMASWLIYPATLHTALCFILLYLCVSISFFLFHAWLTDFSLSGARAISAFAQVGF